MGKIPFHIVSGFLGSGKTTFLKRIIGNYSDKYRLGIIQNEFAPANIDGAELNTSGKDFHLLEINNGSVFCVCLLGDFTRSMEKFIDKFQPEILIIEASGLSDTTSVAEVVSAGTLAGKIFMASNWCVVDALNYEKTGWLKTRVNRQIRMADVVIVNKTDLLAGDPTQIIKEISHMNPFATIKTTVYCDVNLELGDSSISKFYADPGQSLARPDVNSMVIKSSKKVTYESLIRFLEEWAPKSFRIKGFVNLISGETYQVQSVFDRIEVHKSSGYFHPTELVALSDKFTLREWNRSFRNLS